MGIFWLVNPTNHYRLGCSQRGGGEESPLESPCTLNNMQFLKIKVVKTCECKENAWQKNPFYCYIEFIRRYYYGETSHLTQNVQKSATAPFSPLLLKILRL